MNFIDKDTVIILHANNFRDSSYNNYELINNNASIDKEGKFDKCFKFENNSILKLPTSIFNNFRNGDFTLELWLNQINFNNAYPSPFFLGTGYTTNRGIWCHSKNEFTVGITFEDNTIATFALTPSPIQLNRWHHIALVRSVNEYILFIDGLERGRQVHAKNVKNPSADVFLGGTTTQNECCNCKIDEFAITKRALWVTNFTPPTAPYTYKNLDNADSIKDINRLDDVLVNNLECLRIDLKDNILDKGISVPDSYKMAELVDLVGNIPTHPIFKVGDVRMVCFGANAELRANRIIAFSYTTWFEGSIRLDVRFYKKTVMEVYVNNVLKLTLPESSAQVKIDIIDLKFKDVITFKIKSTEATFTEACVNWIFLCSE